MKLFTVVVYVTLGVILAGIILVAMINRDIETTLGAGLCVLILVAVLVVFRLVRKISERLGL